MIEDLPKPLSKMESDFSSVKHAWKAHVGAPRKAGNMPKRLFGNCSSSSTPVFKIWTLESKFMERRVFLLPLVPTNFPKRCV